MKYYKYKMGMVVLNIVAIILMILGILFYYWMYKDFSALNLMFMIYLVLWMFLHEIIHGLAFMSFREVDNKNVVFGAKLESGIFYCMCKQTISKKVILISLLAPLFFIGIITLIISILFDLPTLMLLSLFNISGAAGDIMMTIMFLRLPKDIKYLDLDDCEGFVVLSKENLEKNKYLGFDICESGKYNKEIVPKDFTKITCSKVSIFILIFLMLIVVLEFITTLF